MPEQQVTLNLVADNKCIGQKRVTVAKWKKFLEGTSMDIQSLETRNNGQDWPVIVQSVECPKCLAPEGSPCVVVGDPRNPMLVTGGNRGDWHAERKYAAASLWYQQQAINNP